MQVSVETTSGLGRRMTVQIPAEQIDQQVESKLQQLARSVRLDGFRPGKVPLSVVKKRYGGQVRQETAGELIASSRKTSSPPASRVSSRPGTSPARNWNMWRLSRSIPR
jgi:trigger factor